MKPGRTQQALVGLMVLFGIIAALLGGIIRVMVEQSALLAAHTPTMSSIATFRPTLIEPVDTPDDEETLAPDTPQPETPTHTATINASTTPSPTRRPTRTPRRTTPEASATESPATELSATELSATELSATELSATELSATESSTVTAMIPLPTRTGTLTGTPCHIASGWVSYRVQPGDTIFLIGFRYGVRVDTMLRANCLSSSLIHVGSEVHVPPVTPRPVPTGFLTPDDPPGAPPSTGPTSTLTATDGACTSPDSLIKYPHVGAVLAGIVRITGTARMADFSSFRLELRQEGIPQTFTTFFTGQTPITNGTLTEVDTRQWPNGEYWLRLVVVDSQNNYPERCSILIVFLNPY